MENNKYKQLEERTFKFAENCRNFVKKLPRTISNIEYSKQLIRSSGSQAANYIEANETTTKRDFSHRLMISKKETKESRLWLRLCEINDNELENLRGFLIGESTELMRIFGSILEKFK